MLLAELWQLGILLNELPMLPIGTITCVAVSAAMEMLMLVFWSLWQLYVLYGKKCQKGRKLYCGNNDWLKFLAVVNSIIIIIF